MYTMDFLSEINNFILSYLIDIPHHQVPLSVHLKTMAHHSETKEH